MSRNILIIKLGAIGDVVMALPLISAISASEPDAHITWVCGRIVEPILRLVPRINRIVTVDDNALLKGNTIQRIREIFRLWLSLAGKEYDLTINAYRDKRYRLLTLPLKSRDYSDFMNTDRTGMIIPGRYHGYEFARLYTGIDDSGIGDISYPELFLPAQSTVLQQFDLTSRYVVLAPGGASNFLNIDDVRRWDITSYISLAKELLESGFQVILSGAKNDLWISDYFTDLPVINLVAKTSLIDLLLLLRKSKFLVTHDTGILHLAKLTNTKTFGLFGPVNPLERVGKSDNIDVIWGGEHLPCSPCYDGRKFAQCSNNLCMKNILVEDVMNRVSASLNS